MSLGLKVNPGLGLILVSISLPTNEKVFVQRKVVELIIGDFRVAFRLCFKARSSAHSCPSTNCNFSSVFPWILLAAECQTIQVIKKF